MKLTLKQRQVLEQSSLVRGHKSKRGDNTVWTILGNNTVTPQINMLIKKGLLITNPTSLFRVLKTEKGKRVLKDSISQLQLDFQ